MPYSRDWATEVLITPLGSADPGTLDTIIQQKMADLNERLTDVLVDPAADPWELIGGLRTGVTLMLPAIGAQPAFDEDDTDVTGLYVDSENASDAALYLPIPALAGWDIKTVNLLLNKQSATSVDISFNRGSYGGSPGTTQLGAVTLSASGVQDVALFSGSELTSNARFYWIKWVPTSGHRVRAYAAKIVYDEV